MRWRAWGKRRPLAWLSLAAVFGVLAAEHLPLAWTSAGWMTAGALLFGALLYWQRNGIWACPVIALIFAALHHGTLQQTREHPLRVWLLTHPQGAHITASGQIVHSLRRDLSGTDPGEALLRATRIEATHLGIVWEGITYIKVISGKDKAWPAGEYRITGQLNLPDVVDNPGQFDQRRYLMRLGLVANLFSREAICVREAGWDLGSTVTSASRWARERMIGLLSHDLADAPDELAVILAMALGATENAPPAMQEPFRNSGTLHIFSVSGLHVVMVGTVFWAFLIPFGLPRGPLLLILLPLLFGYAFAAGSPPSAIRAALMAAIFLSGAVFDRRSDLFNSLGAAALVLLLIDTNQLYSVGFQLSFAVLGAIALLMPFIEKRRPKWVEPDPFLPKTLLSAWQRRFYWLRRHVWGSFAVSGAAMLGSLLLIFWNFRLFTPVSLVANVVLVPLSFAMLFTAILTVVTGAVYFTPAQLLFSNANFALAKLTVAAAQMFSGLPYGNIHIPELPPHPPAEITALRLPGGGAANHVRIGDKHWLLDVGPKNPYPFYLGAYLKHRGVRGLEGIVLSHGDAEHRGALGDLLMERSSRQIYAPPSTPWRKTTTKTKDDAKAAPATLLAERALLNLSVDPTFPATATVLYPPAKFWQGRANDHTLVMRLDIGGYRVLWCNDAGFVAEKSLLDTFSEEDLRCDVIIKNHHDGDYSMLPEFLMAVQPRLIISSNQDFPADEKLPEALKQTCEAMHIQLLDQSQTGAVTLRFWEDRLEILPFRGDTQPITLAPHHLK